MPKQVITPFSATLEKYVIHALLVGGLALDAIKPEELSKPGRQVLAAIQKLADGGNKPPHQPDSVFLVCSEIFGGERAAIRVYLQKCMAAGAASEIADVLKAVRDREVLVNSVNQASIQPGSGTLNSGELNEILKAQTQTANLQSAVALLDGGIPVIPTGIPLRSLPALTGASGGLFGFWVIGGETGVGKSCLAWQIALEAGRSHPVLAYDFEMGAETILHRVGEICRGDLDRAKRAVKNIFIRDSIRTLDADVGSLPDKAVIVVDSLQKLPTSVLHRRTSLDQWLHKFESFTKQGHTVLLTSERQRASYGQPTAGGFKESGSIEYSASFAIQIQKEDDDTIKLFCVKSRHRLASGLLCTLERHPEKAWWFREVSFKTQEID